MEETDVIRFVLRRSEWILLIEALAGAAGRIPSDSREKIWQALGVLKVAEDDINTSAMVKALSEIAKYTEHREDNKTTIIHAMAVNGLPKVNTD